MKVQKSEFYKYSRSVVLWFFKYEKYAEEA